MGVATKTRKQKSHPALEKLRIDELYHVIDENEIVIDVVKLLKIGQEKNGQPAVEVPRAQSPSSGLNPGVFVLIC